MNAQKLYFALMYSIFKCRRVEILGCSTSCIAGNQERLELKIYNCDFLLIRTTDISQYRLRFGFSLLYRDRVPFELLDSAALL
jgi:hypothetical protein